MRRFIPLPHPSPGIQVWLPDVLQTPQGLCRAPGAATAGHLSDQPPPQGHTTKLTALTHPQGAPVPVWLAQELQGAPPQSRPGWVFVYGTLKRNGRLHHHIEALKPTSILSGHTPGRLYSLGWYPGMLPATGDGQRVYGELVQVTDIARAVAALDPVEDFGGSYAPGASLYHRVMAPITTQKGELVHAWLYLYAGEVEAKDQVASGRWEVTR